MASINPQRFPNRVDALMDQVTFAPTQFVDRYPVLTDEVVSPLAYQGCKNCRFAEGEDCHHPNSVVYVSDITKHTNYLSQREMRAGECGKVAVLFKPRRAPKLKPPHPIKAYIARIRLLIKAIIRAI